MCIVRQGASFTTTVLVTPLFFGAAHLHHLHDLVHYQRVPLATALAMVGVCLVPNCVCKNCRHSYHTIILSFSGSVLLPQPQRKQPDKSAGAMGAAA